MSEQRGTAPAGAGTEAAEQPTAVLRVVHGSPSPEELAALVCVLAAAGSATGPAAPEPLSTWVDRERALRGRLSPGPGAWRASGLPR